MDKVVETVEEVELWEVEFCEVATVSLPSDVELLIVEAIGLDVVELTDDLVTAPT